MEFLLMFQPVKTKLYKLSIALILFVLCAFHAHGSDDCAGTEIHTTLDTIKKLDTELRNYGYSISEFILNCSYMQDACHAHLLRAKDVDEYHQGMELFDNYMGSFTKVCNYLSNAFNFYKGTNDPTTPQYAETEYYGTPVPGFLNTFKLEGPLTTEERELYFSQEYNRYMEDYIETPFVLDASSIETLESETLYNFVLLPDGTIRVALERPGEREYHERDKVIVEAFHYPNHTILAGTPHQIVITAGAFVMHKKDDKRLFFVSCKSGHFQPSYDSLPYMRTQLSRLGINPYTVICVNDVDLSQAVLKTYNWAQIPVFISTHDCQKLYDIASERWIKTYAEIDRGLFQSLADGDFSMVDAALIAKFKLQRSEATYMRSAYRLFSSSHTAPEGFSEFVRRFGKLKDKIKHFARRELDYDEIKKQAANLLELMDQYEQEIVSYEFAPADTESFYDFLTGNIAHMRDFLDRESLTKVEFHDLKKLSRELCTLFLNLREDFRTKDRGFFINNAAADAFFQINDLMAKTDTIYASREPGNVRVKVPRKIAERLAQNLNHLGIAPPHFGLKFDAEAVFKMVNNAKSVYFTSFKAREFLRKLYDNSYDVHPINYPEISNLFTVLLRNAKVARNAIYFLDARHEVPDSYREMMSQIKLIIDLLADQNFEGIIAEAKKTEDLLYHVPSDILGNYILTDQDSFDYTLKENLSYLYPILNKDHVSEAQSELIIENVQAFRDLVNLIRQNGLLKKPDLKKSILPMSCFDSLEEHADVLLKGLGDGTDVIVTTEMRQSAEIILARVKQDTQDVLNPIEYALFDY